MNYCNPYDPHNPYNLLPITALLLISSNSNLGSVDREKHPLDFSYLNGTACPRNEFRDKLNQEIARSISVNYNEISTAMWESTCCAAKDEQIRLLQNQANSLKIRQAMREIETENLYGNVINQLRSCSESPRYPASKTGECHFDISTKFETDSYTNRISISKGYDTSTLDGEVTVFYSDDRPILVQKNKNARDTFIKSAKAPDDISLAYRMGLINVDEAVNWLNECHQPKEKSSDEKISKEINEYSNPHETNEIYAGDGFIMRALRKLVMAANTVVGWIADELTYGL